MSNQLVSCEKPELFEQAQGNLLKLQKQLQGKQCRGGQQKLQEELQLVQKLACSLKGIKQYCQSLSIRNSSCNYQANKMKQELDKSYKKLQRIQEQYQKLEKNYEQAQEQLHRKQDEIHQLKQFNKIDISYICSYDDLANDDQSVEKAKSVAPSNENKEQKQKQIMINEKQIGNLQQNRKISSNQTKESGNISDQSLKGVINKKQPNDIYDLLLQIQSMGMQQISSIYDQKIQIEGKNSI